MGAGYYHSKCMAHYCAYLVLFKERSAHVDIETVREVVL